MWLGSGGDGHLVRISFGVRCHRTTRLPCRPAATEDRRWPARTAPPRRPPGQAGLARPARDGSIPARRSATTRRRRSRRRSRAAGAAGGPPGPALGGGEAVRPRRPPGHRRRRQGRHDQQGHGGVQPAGLPGHVVQGPDPGGARPRLPVAGPQANAAARARSASSTARTTRTSSSSASTSSSRGRSGRRATTRSTTSRRCSTDERHDDRQVLPVDRSRRAARSASRRATTTRRSAGSSRSGDLEERKRWDDYQAAFDDALSKTSTAAAPWYVIPANRKWFRNLAVATILADTIAEPQAGLPAGAGPTRRPRHRVGRARDQRPLPPPNSVPKTPRMMSWPSREVTTLPPVRMALSIVFCWARAASRWAFSCGLALALGGLLGGGHLARLALDLALLLGRRHRVHAGRRRRVARRPASRPRPRPARRRLAAASRAVIRSWALSRSTVAPYLAWNGLVAIRPWNWTSSIGAISESGASRRVAASGVGTPLRRQDGDERLAGPERGDRLLDVVELGHRERPGGLAQRVGVVGRERPQRVLDAVAELGEDRTTARRSGPGSRSRRRRPSSGSAARSARPGPSAPRTRRRTGGAPRRRRSTAWASAGRPASGRRLVQLGEHPEHERREEARLVHDVRQLEDADDALALGRRAQEVLDLELGLAEEDVGALLLEDDDRAQEHADRRARHPAVVGQDRLALVGREELQGRREVLEVEQRQVVVVAVLEDEGEDRGLRLVEVEDLAEQQRPERVDRRPDLGAELARTATGTRPGGPTARTSSRATSTRSMTLGLVASPGAARPVRSPLMSATKTGTPAFDSWPASSWRVLVLPVPVAPAIRPWRLSMLTARPGPARRWRARRRASGCR